MTFRPGRRERPDNSHRRRSRREKQTFMLTTSDAFRIFAVTSALTFQGLSTYSGVIPC
jgi:hypothetical protein